ncbi:NADH-quinone oxidoreductase subunit C [Streptomyces sp. WY228]|uniref:NADH-quinone oxidoreductase subunit C n=1 Tax=Streptomyces sp. WY228 TaxID=2855836 RepID=UPI001C4EB212|nr:NADH-quinone oxidoreductase subunit C [Streptomyces sp. WY228]QXQ98797.1 NADH-quinone oxidoreductase subunit C [Streptomyces sp. WY228]
MSDRDQHAESAVAEAAVAAEAAEAFDRLPDAVTDLFGDEATAESAYDLLTVDVPAAAWLTALRTARDALGCTYFDWLSAVDEAGVGFRVCAHVVALGTGTVRRLMVRTTVPHDAAALPSAIDVYAGAAWHERETHEMFGVAFDGHPHLVPLLLPEGFEGHPLRKDFVLAARVAKAWPGAKEPGEPAEGHTGPKRRAMLPPGVPDPNEWGPLKGQLPPAAARPARAARAAADRPPRRTRTASEGSAAQRPTPPPGAEAAPPSGAAAPGADGPAVPGAQAPTPASPETPEALETPEAPGTPAAARPRRSRSASERSASQRPEPDGPGTTPARPARRSRSASDGSASQRPEPAESPAPPPAGPEGPPSRPPRVRSTDAPWHDAQPAFGEPEGPEPDSPDEPSQPLRRLRSGGTGAEPPVREGAGRGEAPRSGPTPTEATPSEATPTEATDSEAESAPTPDKPTPDKPTPDHPAGGDPE